MANSCKLLIANASGALSSQIGKIQEAFDAAIKVSDRRLHIEKVDTIALEDKNNVIAKIGVGGYTPNRHTVYLYLDSEYNVSKDEIYNTICHELHHAKRYEGPGFGTTLFDSLVFEGMACCYEEEILIGESYVLKTIKEFDATNELIEKNKQYFLNKQFNYHEWFIAGNANLPKWAGYIMGYKIVKSYLKKVNKKASELVLEDPSQIYEHFLVSDKGRASSNTSDKDAPARND